MWSRAGSGEENWGWTEAGRSGQGCGDEGMAKPWMAAWQVSELGTRGAGQVSRDGHCCSGQGLGELRLLRVGALDGRDTALLGETGTKILEWLRIQVK